MVTHLISAICMARRLVRICDISGAFESMVRMVVMRGSNSLEEVAHMFSKAELPTSTLEKFVRFLNKGTTLAKANISPHLVRLVSQAHLFSWFTIQGTQDYTFSLKGSIPGDPLGDILFNFLKPSWFMLCRMSTTKTQSPAVFLRQHLLLHQGFPCLTPLTVTTAYSCKTMPTR